MFVAIFLYNIFYRNLYPRTQDMVLHNFLMLLHISNYNKGRTCFEMEDGLLGKGDVSEIRFALGKIILKMKTNSL